jgi:general secretion pathway protein G
MKPKAFHRGFTLIELVITVAIIGLLATAAMPLAELGYQRSKERDLRSALSEIRSAIDAYKLAAEQGRVATELGTSGYPPSLRALVEGIDDARSAESAKVYFLRRLPRDPMFPDATAPAESTWGLRAYASPPDAPQAGEDVFDVYSWSEQSGINGVPYREW